MRKNKAKIIDHIVNACYSDKKEIFYVKKPLGVFNLWCCDCDLRHEVWVEDKKDKIAIFMVRDDRATDLQREVKKLKKKIKRLK